MRQLRSVIDVLLLGVLVDKVSINVNGVDFSPNSR